jgi:hypothetical protein
VAAGGTAAVFAMGSYSRTFFVRGFVLGAVWLSGLVAGFTASRMNRGAAGAGTWSVAAPCMVVGAVLGVVTFLALLAIAGVAVALAFVHSGWLW